MKKQALFRLGAVTILAAGLLACATPRSNGDPVPCGTPVCHVTVTVKSCDAITADPPVIGILHGNTNSQIHWKLDKADGYSFTDDGVYIKEPRDDQFSKDPTGNDQLFKLKNKNSVKQTYKYGIKLKGPAGVCTLDPIIVNDM